MAPAEPWSSEQGSEEFCSGLLIHLTTILSGCYVFRNLIPEDKLEGSGLSSKILGCLRFAFVHLKILVSQ